MLSYTNTNGSLESIPSIPESLTTTYTMLEKCLVATVSSTSSYIDLTRLSIRRLVS